VIAAFAAAFYYWPSLKGIFLKTNTVEFVSSYQISNLSCSFQNSCAQISFTFNSTQKALSQVPTYQIKETPEEAKTEIIFNNVTEISDNFTYEQVINNPLIEDISYEQVNDAFILTVKRKGNLVPAQVTIQGNIATIKLPEDGSGYPQFLELEPDDNSTVYPLLQKIKTKVILKDSLKKGLFYLNDADLPLQIKDLGNNEYYFEASEKLVTDQNYQVKTIAIDSQNRASVKIWEFDAQMALAKINLGDDRFKYLGWWGDINSTSTPVMSEPSNQSKQLDTFSTINRVKVLKEVYGESIDGNNLWLKIDGGKHPGTYIFSAFVTPIPQPEPPKNFSIPPEVKPGEYWIDTDLTKKILTLFQYDKPIFATYVAIGRPGNPTIEGTYRIWYKLLKTRMRGGPPVVQFFYDLPNVPYVMYYYKGYGLHGTYWHDKFGTRQSSGCTNLTQGDSKFLFEHLQPTLPDGKNSFLSNPDNPGSVIYNHY